MRRSKLVSLIFFAALILVACGRSKESQFYVLNPIQAQKEQSTRYRHLQIGIDVVNYPSYLEKQQLMIHRTAHQLELKELDQWAEALPKNILRVVAINLATLLPGAVVQGSPWDNKFKPNYHLQLTIREFRMDLCGNSVLLASYLIYQDEQLIEKKDVDYRLKLAPVSIEALVISMNTNLSHLSQRIARSFAGLSARKNDIKYM